VLKRPTSRRKSKPEGITLNLVPVLDAMVTLIAFLLFTMSFLTIVSIESPFPTASPKDVEQKLKEKPLQLTISLNAKDTEIWSPFERIQSKKVPNTPEGQPDVKAIHEVLLGVKQQFPRETQVVMAPYPGITYDMLVSIMDSTRNIDKTDPPIFVKNQTSGNDEPLKALFPDIMFGNLLGDT
jgi:biopolymer transport protein ExbD